MRTEQDNNIKNYSVGELIAMRNRLQENPTIWSPFTITEIIEELEVSKGRRLYSVYGVELTPLQQMEFGKWLNNSGMAMNTKTKEERKQIVLDWITSNA